MSTTVAGNLLLLFQFRYMLRLGKHFSAGLFKLIPEKNYGYTDIRSTRGPIGGQIARRPSGEYSMLLLKCMCVHVVGIVESWVTFYESGTQSKYTINSKSLSLFMHHTPPRSRSLDLPHLRQRRAQFIDFTRAYSTTLIKLQRAPLSTVIVWAVSSRKNATQDLESVPMLSHHNSTLREYTFLRA